MAFKAKPVSLDLTQRARNRVQALGIELEGGWEKLPKGTMPIRDGSVRGLSRAPTAEHRTMQRRYEELGAISNTRGWSVAETEEWSRLSRALLSVNSGLQIGEIPSPPLGIHAWEPWVRSFYPHAVNETCGMHVHMSFGNNLSVYQRLMVEEYPTTVIEEFIKWANQKQLGGDHCLYPRLAGLSEFCQHTFWPDAQTKSKEKEFNHHAPGNRYSVMNYCYGRHQTIECRLLPMFGTNDKADPDTAVEAIKHLIAITNHFLVDTRNLARVHSVNLTIPDDYREEFIECV